MELLDRFQLVEKRDDFAGTLSGGQRKLLEMARALMTRPELIMLDEPMAGVNPALTQSLLEHVKDLREEGITVVFVEHDMDVVRDISDWVVVMAEGAIIAEGDADSIGANKTVIDAYLGAHHDAPLDLEEEAEWLGGPNSKERVMTEPIIKVDNVVAGYVPGVDILNGANLEVAPGELIGIIGPNGAGKSTMLKALFGLITNQLGHGHLPRRRDHGHEGPCIGFARDRLRPPDQQRVPQSHDRREPGNGRVPQTEDLQGTPRVRRRLVSPARRDG